MIRTETRDGDIIVIDDAGGPRPRGCAWDESVCTQTREYRVQYASGQDSTGEVDVFCPRHYALTLAELVEVHLVGCEGSAADHIVAFERVG